MLFSFLFYGRLFVAKGDIAMITDEKQKRIFARNLSLYVANSGKQQKEVAAALGFNQKTFNGWCNALSMPTMGKVQALADYFGIAKTDLLDEHSYETKKVSAVRIPVLGRVAAGIPIDAIEEIIDYEEITDDMAKTGEYFGLLIRGDSMEPKISNGDVVIVKKQDDADDGDLVIAIVNGNEGCCKRIKKYDDGTIALVSTNPAYSPMFFTASEQTETPVRIIGKVKELRAKF